MSTLDETPDTAVAERRTGAQTVAPTSASALLFAASILGEGGYTPEAELKRSLEGTRPHEVDEVVPAPAPAPAPAQSPAPVPAPVVETPRPSVVPPARVEARVEPAAPVAEPVTKGWFARFLDKLFGRG